MRSKEVVCIVLATQSRDLPSTPGYAVQWGCTQDKGSIWILRPWPPGIFHRQDVTKIPSSSRGEKALVAHRGCVSKVSWNPERCPARATKATVTVTVRSTDVCCQEVHCNDQVRLESGRRVVPVCPFGSAAQRRRLLSLNTEYKHTWPWIASNRSSVETYILDIPATTSLCKPRRPVHAMIRLSQHMSTRLT